MTQPRKTALATRVTSHGLSIATVLIGLSILLVLTLTGHLSSQTTRSGVHRAPVPTGGIPLALVVWVAFGVVVLVLASYVATRGRLDPRAGRRRHAVTGDENVSAVLPGSAVAPIQSA